MLTAKGSNMVFDSDRQHFFRYQKAPDAATNKSTPDRMTAYVTEKSTARLPKLGDVIWVLARVGESKPSAYRFIYAFVVDEVPSSLDGERRFFGSRGLWLEDSGFVQDLPWFKAFFDQMGNGGTSIRLIEEKWLTQLRALYADAGPAGLDGPDALEAEARSESWPEDVVRFGAIRARRGQAEFRAKLLVAYRRRCCISRCEVEAILEAAHIRPHATEPNYDTRNGLLLRADLHTLFDLHLLGVDEYGRIHLSPSVTDLYYRELMNKAGRITYPDKSADRPSDTDLQARMKVFRRE